MARKEKTIHYIYKTTCNVTGRWYIGMHSAYNLDDGYMGSGLRLRRSIRKYGVENHTKEILEFFETREELVLREIEIVTKELVDDPMCMNLKEGGQGGFSSEEHIKNCRIGSSKFLKNKWQDVEYKNKILSVLEDNRKFMKKITESYSWEGKNHTEETKLKMSEKKKGTGVGETNSQYGTCWITKDSVNKKIKKEDLETYLNDGWVQGRKI